MLTISYRIGKSKIHKNGIFAAADIARGKTVYKPNMKILEKISIKELKKWKLEKIKYFLHYSFQGGKRFYFAGISNFRDKKPTDDSFYMNHSCNPNCWHEGEKIVARRNIQKAEELTIDYGTIMAPNGLEKKFQCFCDEKECRKWISKNDCLKRQLQKKYVAHFPPFILEMTKN